MRQNRPTVQYQDVALFKSNTGAYVSGSNAGDNLKFIQKVQGINFSIDVGSETTQSISSQRSILNQKIKSPDVNLTVNTIEDFGDMWKTFLDARMFEKKHIDADCNFYVLLNNKLGTELTPSVSAYTNKIAFNKFKDITGLDMIGFGNMFLTNISMSQSVNGLLTSQYSFVGSNLEAQNPIQVNTDITDSENLVYFHDFEDLTVSASTIHNNDNVNGVINGTEGTGYLLASEFAGGSLFISDVDGDKALEIRDAGDLFAIGLSGFSGGGVYMVSGTYSITGTQNLAEKVTGFSITPYGGGSDNIFIDGNNPVGGGGDTDQNLSGKYSGTPGETHSVKYQSMAFDAPTHDLQFAVFTTDGVTPTSAQLKTGFQSYWYFADSDFDPTQYSLDRATHPWLCRWGSTNAPTNESFPNLVANISGFAFTGFTGDIGSFAHSHFCSQSPINFNINTIMTSSPRRDINESGTRFNYTPMFYSGAQTGVLPFSGSGFVGDDERILFHRSSSASITVGNNAVSNEIPNSSKTRGSVFIHDLSVKKMSDIRFDTPAIDITGSNQLKNTTGIFDKYPTNYEVYNSGEIYTARNTSLTIRGRGNDTGVFFVKPDLIQSFDINIPVGRQKIGGIGKTYPVDRKSILPTRGNLTVNTKVSDIHNEGVNSSTNQYVTQGENYDLNITFNNDWNKVISNAVLESVNLSSSIGNQAGSEMQFSFDITDVSIPSGLNPISTSGISHGYSLRKVNPFYNGPAMKVRTDLGIEANVFYDVSGKISDDSRIEQEPRSEINKFSQLYPVSTAIQVETWYDQFGGVNLITTGIDPLYFPILHSGGSFMQSGISFDTARHGGQPDSTGTYMKFSENIQTKEQNYAIRIINQSQSTNDVNTILGQLNQESSSYIFFSHDRSAYQISADGNVGKRETGRYYINGLECSQDGTNSGHYDANFFFSTGTLQMHLNSYKQDSVQGFDALGAAKINNSQRYFGRFAISELLMSSGNFFTEKEDNQNIADLGNTDLTEAYSIYANTLNYWNGGIQ